MTEVQKGRPGRGFDGTTLPHPTAFDPWPTQPHTRRQTCSLDCNVCGWAPSCFSARGSAASQVTLMMPRTTHLCAPLLALCLPLLVPFLWIHRPRFQWLGHDGPGPLSHRASALWNPLIPCFPGRGPRPSSSSSTAFPPSNPCYANFALPQVGLSYYRHGKCSGGGGGLPPWVPPALCVEKGHGPRCIWLFWAKKRPRGQNFWANFSGQPFHRGGHPVVPSGPAGCTGVWGRWPVGDLHGLAPGSGSRGVVPKP